MILMLLTSIFLTGPIMAMAPQILNPSHTAQDINTQLLTAAKKGSLDSVKQLLKQGANKEATDEDGNTPLHLAAQNGHNEVCQILSDMGANVNATNENDETPLITAAYNSRKEVCQILIEKGANIYTADCADYTPLHGAAYHGQEEICKILFNYLKLPDTTPPLVKTSRHRLRTALLCFKRGLPLIPRDVRNIIFLSIPELQKDVAYILLNRLQMGLPIKSLLFSNPLSLKAAALLILEIRKDLLDSVYTCLDTDAPQNIKELFCEDTRETFILPLIKNSLIHQMQTLQPQEYL